MEKTYNNTEREALARVVAGDVGTGDTVDAQGSLVIRGAIRPGAHVRAQGDVFVQGSIAGAIVESAGGRVAVRGLTKDATIRAALDIACHSAFTADINAAGDVHLLQGAHSGVIRSGGNLYLSSPLSICLRDVELYLGGGIIQHGRDASFSAAPAMNRERGAYRVKTDLRADIAPYGDTLPRFQPCAIEDLSTTGAFCRVLQSDAANAFAQGITAQLKLTLPGYSDHIIVVAHIARLIGGDGLGLHFLDMPQRDHRRLKAHCLQIALQRQGTPLGTRDRRGREGQEL